MVLIKYTYANFIQKLAGNCAHLYIGFSKPQFCLYLHCINVLLAIIRINLFQSSSPQAMYIVVTGQSYPGILFFRFYTILKIIVGITFHRQRFLKSILLRPSKGLLVSFCGGRAKSKTFAKAALFGLSGSHYVYALPVMNGRMRKRPLAKLAEQSAHHKSYMFRHVIPLCHHLHTIRTDMALFVLLVIIIQCIFCGYLPADRVINRATGKCICFFLLSYAYIIALFRFLLLHLYCLVLYANNVRYGNDDDERCDRRAQSLDVAQMLRVEIVNVGMFFFLKAYQCISD